MFTKNKNKKKSNNDFYIFVEVLQNGVPVTWTEKPISNRGKLVLSNNYKGDLAIPLYPFSEDINIIRFSKGRIFLTLDQPWHGIIKSNGNVNQIMADDRARGFEFQLVPEDYATLSLNDLKLLIRLGKKSTSAETFAKMKGYSGNLIRLFFPEKRDVSTLIGAGLITATIFGGLITLSLAYEDIRPQKLEELSEEYILPFIAPDHIRTSPEALQEHLDRKNYVPSVVRYYRQLSNTIAGNLNDSDMIPSVVTQRFRGYYANQLSEIKNNINDQSLIDAKSKTRPETAMIAFPTVLGESYRGSLLRIVDKLDLYQQSLSTNLESRRNFVEKFTKEETYNYREYKNLAPSNDKAKEFLSKIRPWNALPDEGLMYQEAKDIANRAAMIQQDIFGSQSNRSNLTVHSAKPVGMPTSSYYSTFVPSRIYDVDNKKPYLITASRFSGRNAKKVEIKEPLVGKIDPSVIEKTVYNNRFALKVCYELLLRKDESLGGEMTWQWVINSVGKVKDLKLLENELVDKTFVDCISQKVGSWKFPKPKDGSVQVTHVFQFRRDKTTL